MKRFKRRWGDDDRHFGPFTFARREKWRPFAILLSSGSSDPEEGGCHLRVQAFGCTLICELPALVKPDRSWVDTSQYDWNKGNPGAGYWDEHRRDYGFSLCDGFLQVKLGRQTHDSSTTQDWGYFLPWTQWRQVSHKVFNPDGSLHADVARWDWRERFDAIDKLPRIRFAIVDHDGECVTASTHVEERRWRRGTGWFRWLGYVWPVKRDRSLDIRFASEVGPEKGSWKGGLIGHGISMLAGETPDEAMRRYCSQEHRAKGQKYRLTFVGRMPEPEVVS